RIRTELRRRREPCFGARPPWEHAPLASRANLRTAARGMVAARRTDRDAGPPPVRRVHAGAHMQTGTWHRRGSTIELHEGDLHEGAPPASVSGEEDELLSSLFSSALSGARQGSDYLRSRFRAPAPTPVSPPSTRAPRAVSATRFPVPESALTSLLPAFAEYRYDFSAGRYPWKLPGVSLPLAPP